MKPNLPAISYIVTAKKYKNNAGLERVHEKIFNAENLSDARKSAFDYFSIVLEMLTETGEIKPNNYFISPTTFSKKRERVLALPNNFEICYEKPTDFERGIQIYIRINKPINLGSRILQKDEKFLIQSFNFLNDEENKTIAENLNIEVEIFAKLKQETGKVYRINFVDENGYLNELNTLETYNRFNGKSFENYKNNIEKHIENKAITEISELIKNPNPLKFEICDVLELENINETICAFLNGAHFGYILLEDKRKFHAMENSEMKEILQNFIYKRFVWNEHFIRFHRFKMGSKKYHAISVDGKNCNESVMFSKNLDYDYEYFERSRFGNILDFDKCENFENKKSLQ